MQPSLRFSCTFVPFNPRIGYPLPAGRPVWTWEPSEAPYLAIMKKIFLSLLFVGSVFVVSAHATGKYFVFSGTAKDAYGKAVSLRLQEARTALDGLRSHEPDNLIPVLIENYVDFLTVFINDNKQDYKRLSRNMDARLSKIARGDRRSPYYLYCQAEVRLQWAFLRSRFGDYLSAMSDVKQAYALLEENQRKFPDFVANKKSLGIMHALVGNIPEEYRWTLKVLGGMTGTTTQGLQELEEVLEYARHHEFIFEEEALVAYAFLMAYLNNQVDNGWKTLQNSALHPRENPLAAYAMAMVAMRAGKNEEAIALLREAPTQHQQCPFWQRDYLLGVAKLRRLDSDANQYLTSFLQNYRGDNGVKEGYQKMGWYHAIAGNSQGYFEQMESVRQRGDDQTEPDKVALREAKTNEMPDQTLLKARLLFDGGYYQRAYDLLKNAAPRYERDTRLHLEYHYRLARVYHKMGRTAEAVKSYQQTVEKGEKAPWYFACNAALQLGLLYEEKRDFQNAAAAFRRCLRIKPEEYAGSLHGQAKAGLGRVQ